ncbi:MAG: hypothetical protein E7313_03390, partial [Clostridiales bacterium]|nr:hypothetical protein [Clostridiales bacterium]
MRRTKKEKALVLILILLLAIVAISYITVRFKAKSNVVTHEVIEQLMAENEDNPESVNYLVTDSCISRVYPETEVETFVTSFSEGEEVKVYTDKLCTQEVTDGFVMSGMYAKYTENDRVFEISVLGDIDENEAKGSNVNTLVGDGVLNQIELTRDIRESIEDDNWKISEEVERKSADVNCTGIIDERAVQSIVEYIVFGNLNIDEVELVEKPTVEVVLGDLNENTVYTTNVKLKINENEENALKTVYKITGDKVEDYKLALDGEEVVLNENGIYRITAYTYGELENKSKREYVIINICKTANYAMEYYLENVDGTYTKVEEDTKIEEGIIGNVVEIEEKQYTDYELNVDNSNGKLSGEVLEDGSLVLKAYYDRKSYSVTVTAGDNIENVSIADIKNASDANSIKVGKTVAQTLKWGEKVEVDAEVSEVNGYTVEWDKWQKVEGSESIADKKSVIVVGKENVEYVANANKTAINYNIKYNLQDGKLAEGVTNPKEYNIETPSFILNNPSKQGYIFEGWTGTGLTNKTEQVTVASGSTGDREYTANWKAIENTPYVIEHYKENLDGTYKLVETENKEGKTDTVVDAISKTYVGFTFDEENENNILSGKILSDGSLKLKVYYSRNTYNLTITVGENIGKVSAEGILAKE